MAPSLNAHQVQDLSISQGLPSTSTTDRPSLAGHEMITDRYPSGSSSMDRADLLYSDSGAHAHPFNQTHAMDILSLNSSSLPYMQYDQFIPNAISQSMNLDFNSHNKPGQGSSLDDILNAESYVYRSQDEPNPKSPSKPIRAEGKGQTLPFGVTQMPAKSKTRRLSIEEHDGRRKKKARVELLSEEDEASKKSRGRPRLDPQDKTAADRRRTQIRNAQRAYRSRKETTISSLENEVQELRGNNEEMSDMFMKLYEVAVGKGLLQREPEFAQHLQSTTERFLKLAKASMGDESSKDDESVAENRGKSDRSNAGRQPSTSAEPPKPTNSPDVVSAWGYQISNETPSPPDESQQAHELLGFQENVVSQDRDREALQTITHATPDNASFFDMTRDLQQYSAYVPSMDTYSQFIPQEFLPLPNSFAYSEKSFARRLHREASQRGYKLICATPPPLDRLNEVFSFCLKYSSKAQIKARLERVVFSSAKDNLQAWGEPFVHIGGAGTYYPTDEADSSGMPNFGSGLSMGPFREGVIATQEKYMEDNMKTNLPGFEGKFFDPNDVDNYLRGRGINILAGMQFVQVDLEALVPFDVSVPTSVANTSQTFSPRTPLSPQASFTAQGGYFTSVTEDYGAFNAEEAINDPNSKPNDFSALPLRFPAWNSEDVSPVNTQDAFGPTEPIFDSMPFKQPNDGIPVNMGNHGKISLSVDTLMDLLIAKTVCLGRAPGFRREDVDNAIWSAVTEAVSV